MVTPLAVVEGQATTMRTDTVHLPAKGMRTATGRERVPVPSPTPSRDFAVPTRSDPFFDPLVWYLADAAMHGVSEGYGASYFFSWNRVFGSGYGYGHGNAEGGGSDFYLGRLRSAPRF